MKYALFLALAVVAGAVPSHAAAPPDPPSVCLKIATGFGIDCVPGQGIAALSKDCTEAEGESAVAACTKDAASADAETRIWARVFRAFVQTHNKHFDAALADFDAALAAKPDLYLALAGRAVVYVVTQKYALARRDAERARTLQPNNFVSYVILCALDAAVGDVAASKADVLTIQTMTFDNAELYYLRGSFFAKALNANDLALADFTTALALDPHHTKALIGRSYLYANTNRTDLAIADCNGVTESGKDADIHRCLGYAYEMAGRDGEALAEFDRSIALKPGDADALQNRGSIYLLNGLYDKAVADLEAAVVLRSDEMGYYSNLGLAHRHLGHPELAVADFGKAIRLKPDDPVPYLNRGVVYMDIGDFDRAQADFQKALELSPGDRRALAGIWRAQQKKPVPLGPPPRNRLGVSR